MSGHSGGQLRTLTGLFKSAFGRDVSHYDGRTLLTFQLSDNSVILDAANKRFLVPFHEVTTSAIRFQGDALEGVFEFRATAPDGTTIRPLYGPFVLQREVA